MVNLMTYPFSLRPDGTINKQEDGEDYYSNELINLILTEPGERSLVPEYGITDPVFDHVNVVELLGKIEMFGPPVDINAEEGVVVEWPRDGVMDLAIDYTVSDSLEDTGFDDDLDDYDDYFEENMADEVDPYGLVEATEF